VPEIKHSEVSRLIKECSPKASVILEIGASDGADTNQLLVHNRKSVVHAFECEPRAIAKWRKKVRSDRAFLYETAISNADSTATFHPSGGNPGGSYKKYGDWDKSGSLLPFDRHSENAPWMEFPEPFTVTTTTLDAWAAEHLPGGMIDFVWCDVQGAEQMVVEGAHNTMKRIRYFYCECDSRPNYKGQATREDLIAALPGFSLVAEYSYNLLFKNNAPKSPPVPRAASVAENPPRPPRPSRAKPITKTFRGNGSVSVQMIGRIGNQMFQYCAGKILAELSGLRYDPPAEFVDKAHEPVQWTGPPSITMQPSVQTKEPAGQAVRLSGLQWIDIQKANRASSVDVTDSYMQRYELYKAWKDKIRYEWLRIQRPWLATEPDAVYVHVRRDDYIASKSNPLRPGHVGEITSLDEYGECLKLFPNAKQLILTTDSPDDPFLQEFDKFGLPWKVTGLPWDEDFMTLASCKWMIMSQSTFSWWAAFLGRAERIACPVFPGSFWHNGINDRGFPHLYVDDEPDRFHWVGTEGNTNESPQATE